MADDKRSSRPFGVPVLIVPDRNGESVDADIAAVRSDLRALSAKHDALASDVAEVRETGAATSASVNILLSLATEDRAERRLREEGRVRARTEETKLQRVRVSARAKIIVAAITAAAAGAGFLAHHFT